MATAQPPSYDYYDHSVIGRVLRASTRGFTFGTHSGNIGQNHDFGAFVKVPVANDEAQWVIGLIYAVEIKDDLLISELVMSESVNPSILRDQRENRLIPVEISVLNIGYYTGEGFIHSLPPRPPMSLAGVSLCTIDDVVAFTYQPDYLRLVLQAREVPAEDLAAMTLRYAALCYENPDERRVFLVNSGRHLAKLLTGDLKKLAQILALIRPS